MDKLLLRKAIPQDKDRVLSFCQNTWEWGDYIADVWDSWLNDNKGEFIVALLDGIPLAIMHLKITIDNEGWLEGLRVDPSFRMKGIAEKVSRYAVDRAFKKQLPIIRCLILESNTGSRRIGEKIGFKQVCLMYSYRAECKERDSQKLVRVTTIDQVDDLWSMVKDSEVYRSSSGLYLTNWFYLKLTKEKIAQHIKDNEVFVLQEENKIRAFAIVINNSFGGGNTISYLDGSPDSIEILINELKKSIVINKCDHLEASVPDLRWLTEKYEKAGYKSYFGQPIIVY
ncbi:MAG: GNAT family N-acetyltransferase [Chloroflexi bacterium]|nr:GNAT family N-acetyltransferase [Chloroflexota bacterium]